MLLPINRHKHVDFDYCAHPFDTFVLLFFSYFVCPSFHYISYPLAPHPHPPLVIQSCFTVLLLSLSPSPSPISLCKHFPPSRMILMSCSFAPIHSFIFYYPLYRYRTIPGTFTHALSHTPRLETPLPLGRLLLPSSIALFERLAGVVHTTRGCRSASLPRSSGFASLGLGNTMYNSQQNNRTILLPSPTHTYHNLVLL